MVDRPRPRGHPAVSPYYVLVDGSALFLAVRALGEGRPLDYRALIDVLCESVSGLTPPTGRDSGTQWVMWTSAASDNAGQSRFLEFAERELHWTVRRVAPADSFMVDPASAFGLAQDSRVAGRLMRFDASIAFAVARIADTHNVVVVSDSFPLADPLQRAARFQRNSGHRNVVAFFGRALDARWQRLLRDPGKFGVDFVDLDDFEPELFGVGQEVVKTSRNVDTHPF